MRKQVRRLSAVFDDYNTNVFFPPVVTLSLQRCIRISSSSSGVTCTVVEMFQDAGTFPYLRITRTRCPPGGIASKKANEGGGGWRGHGARLSWKGERENWNGSGPGS